MKTLLSILFVSLFISSCAGQKLKISEGDAPGRSEERLAIINAVEAHLPAFDVMEKIGVPDKVYAAYNGNVIQAYWFYENKYPFNYSFVIYFEDGISQNFTQVGSIEISLTEEVDQP